MVFTVWEAHGEVSGRAWEPLFSRSRREGLSEGFRRGPQIDFLPFWRIFGLLWETIFGEKVHFFGGPVFSRFLVRFWEGPAAGVGPAWASKTA